MEITNNCISNLTRGGIKINDEIVQTYRTKIIHLNSDIVSTLQEKISKIEQKAFWLIKRILQL